MSLIDKLLGRPAGKKLKRAEAPAANAGSVAASAPIARVPVKAAERPTAKQAFPRFQLTAGDRLDPRLSDRMAGVRMKLRSAYTPSQPVIDRRMFAGRTEVLTTLIRSLEDQRLHIVIYGERGIGKTSLLHVLTQAARDARYIVVYCSCGAGSSFNEMFRAVAADIPLLFHSGFAPTTAEAERGGSLADLMPEGELSPRLVSDVFAKLTGTRVIVVLDEFDRCESIEFRRGIAELIKNLSDRSIRVQLVIAGVAANLTELVEHIPSIRRNVFALQIPKMSATEVRHLVRNGEAATGVTFEQDALEFVIRAAHGSPYIASLLSHHAGLMAIDNGRMAVSVEHVSSSIIQALEEFKGRISKASQMQIDQLGDPSRHPLGFLAGEALFAGGWFGAAAVDDLQASGFPGAKSVIAQLAASRVLIEPSEDEFGVGYRFHEESVTPYLWIQVARARFMDARQRDLAEVGAREAVGGNG